MHLVKTEKTDKHNTKVWSNMGWVHWNYQCYKKPIQMFRRCENVIPTTLPFRTYTYRNRENWNWKDVGARSHWNRNFRIGCTYCFWSKEVCTTSLLHWFQKTERDERTGFLPHPRNGGMYRLTRYSKMFSTLDYNSEYWQTLIHHNDRNKADFASRQGLFKFIRI